MCFFQSSAHSCLIFALMIAYISFVDGSMLIGLPVVSACFAALSANSLPVILQCDGHQSSMRLVPSLRAWLMSICRWSVMSLRVLLCPVFMLVSALSESVMMAALGGLLSIIQCSACCIAINSAVYIDRCSLSLYVCVCLMLGIVNAQPTCLLFMSLLPSVYICKWFA